jgi:hypothetical protein
MTNNELQCLQAGVVEAEYVWRAGEPECGEMVFNSGCSQVTAT